jgi:hypothetical protein
MKATLFTTLCSLGLLVSRAPLANALDAIDDLLAGASTAAESDLSPQVPLIVPDGGSADAAAFDAAVFRSVVTHAAPSPTEESPAAAQAHSAPWAGSGVIGSAAAAGSVAAGSVGGRDEVPAHAPDHKSAPFNAVPEPTAMVMAVLALIYFLVFGRRRRVI